VRKASRWWPLLLPLFPQVAGMRSDESNIFSPSRTAINLYILRIVRETEACQDGESTE
jgi:hypothetical protein